MAGGRLVRTSHLVQTPAAVVGYVSGRPFRPSGTASSSPYGIYRFAVPGSGLIHRLPGAPLGDGTAIWLHAEDSNPFTVSYTTSNVAASRDLTIRVIAKGRQIQAAAGPLEAGTGSEWLDRPGQDPAAEPRSLDAGCGDARHGRAGVFGYVS